MRLSLCKELFTNLSALGEKISKKGEVLLMRTSRKLNFQSMRGDKLGKIMDKERQPDVIRIVNVAVSAPQQLC